MSVRSSRWVCILLIPAFVACGRDHANTDAADRVPGSAGGAGAPSVTEAPETEMSEGGMAGAQDVGESEAESPATPGGLYCVISADCASGKFCDLGECVTNCAADADCEDGLECSPRGRCMQPDEVDHDPPPVTDYAGVVSVAPTSIHLTEVDEHLELRLSTDADEPVKYRVEVVGPHLSITEPRGSIEGDTTVTVDVDPDAVQGLEAFGTVHIYTSLGNLVVDAPIRVGMTDAYQGVLRYESGGVPFGTASMNLELQEQNGDVEVRVDPHGSLLFPESFGQAGGRGIFTVSEGLEFNLAQSIEAHAGGNRNHFGRPIGRTLSFALKPTADGHWEGDFEERIHGVLAQPVTLRGTAFLARSHTDPGLTFDLGETVEMPDGASEALPDPNEVFGWSWEDCELGARQLAGCDSVNSYSCIAQALETRYYTPFFDALNAHLKSADPLSDLRSDCEREMLVPATAAPVNTPSCALIAPLACGLRSLVSFTSPTQEQVPETFTRLYARMLAPPLFVAQDHIVEGFKQSLIEGSSVQAEHYAQARDALDAPLRWALAPSLLEFMRRMPAYRVDGDPDAVDPTERDYPAVRALGRALHVLSLLDAEEGRLHSAKVTSDPDEQKAVAQAAQESAVLTLLDAVALSALLESWGSPAELGNEFTGFLSEFDRGFSALRQGALSFGVPDGEIAFVFDPARGQPTNFEQLLLAHAAPAFAQFEVDEQNFLASERSYEQNQESLERELEQIRVSQDEALHGVCGAEFDPDSIATEQDWATCGADGTGQIAELTLEIEQAQLRLQAAEGRVLAASRKIDIDVERLAATQQVHQSTLKFIDDAGQELESLTIQEGVLNAVQSALTVAANASLWNGGAPLAMAAGVAAIEGMRTQINVARGRLETEKEMHFEQASAEIELINGMADIQRQLVDLRQLELEILQDCLATVQAALRRSNALDAAKRALVERQRIMDRIVESSAADPLHRVLQDKLALRALDSRAKAQQWLYRSGRALEYEINTPLGEGLGRAVLGAHNSQEMSRLRTCYQSLFADHLATYGTPQTFSTTLSVRELLGIAGDRKDEVTGETLSAGELFRRVLLQNQNLDRGGNVEFRFSTNLMPGNGLWSTNVCDDKVTQVRAQLVGDFQGDGEAEIDLRIEGGAVMRRCDSDDLIHWDIESPAVAVIQAGVNEFGPKANTSLFGQSVARASWTLIIPSGDLAPANADLDLETLEDIVLEIDHAALPRREGATSIDISCLGTIGAG